MCRGHVVLAWKAQLQVHRTRFIESIAACGYRPPSFIMGPMASAAAVGRSDVRRHELDSQEHSHG